jgi:flagellar protein FlaG
MASEISNVASSSAAHAPAAMAPPGKSMQRQLNVAPKVIDIKPVDIQFDPTKARQNLHAAVSMLNEQMASTKQGLGFSFDESINAPVIKVSNIHTGEVVRQIPTEDVLHMAHTIDALKGILFNKAV